MTTNNTTAEPTTDGQSRPPPPFDQRASALLRHAHMLIFSECPEVRSLASVIDYYGNLNDAQVQRGVWSSDRGRVESADAIFGSMFQTMRLLEEQWERGIGVLSALRRETEEASAQLLQLREELQLLRDGQRGPTG